MKKEILLSIICPVYNGEKVVGKLIESLESQSYKDYELILVNDGSEDNTLKVLKDYAKKYKNIVVVDKKHGGLSDTRNVGIENAKGKYITIGDCDDWYSSDFFEKIIPIIKEEPFDLLVFNAKVMNYDEFMYNLIPSKYKNGKFIEKNGVTKYLQGKFRHQIGNVTWNKIYVKDIITKNKLKYQVDKTKGQDLLFNILYASKIKHYKYVDEKLYYYALNMNTITTKVYRNIHEENLKYYAPIKKICLDNNIKNWEHYLGLFYLRKLPIIILNETNNKSYKVGKENIQKHLKDKDIEHVLKKVKFKNLDAKLLISYVLYKLKLYKPVYFIVWHLRNK